MRKITILLIMGLCSLSAYSQKLEDFKVIYGSEKKVGGMFKQFDKNLIHFPSTNFADGNEGYKVIDKYGNMKVYTQFSTGIKALWNDTPFGFVQYATSPVHSVNFLHAAKGLFFISNIDSDPEFTKYIRDTSFANIKYPTGGGFYFGNPMAGLCPIVINEGSGNDWNFVSYYLYSNATSLNKVKADKVDSAAAVYNFPEGVTNGHYKISYTPLTWHPYTNDIWLCPVDPNIILRLNLTTEEFTRYDSTNMPIRIGAQMGVPEKGIYNLLHYNFLASEKRTTEINGYPEIYDYYFPVFAARLIDSTDNGHIVADNVLLYYKDDIWDTIRIVDPGLAKYNIKNKYSISSFRPLWTNNTCKILMHFEDVTVYYDGELTEDWRWRRTFSVYDTKNKTCEHITVPASLFGYYGADSNSNQALSVQWVDTYTNADGKTGYGISLYNGNTDKSYFVQYIPPIGDIDETENSIFIRLLIESITPNPATNQATVNIMYYPSGIYSNDLEVGLYNYMGEKIIDLTPLGTYTDHNHTWEATFDIPKRLAGGMYFLNVRSGDESRTKGIAIY